MSARPTPPVSPLGTVPGGEAGDLSLGVPGEGLVAARTGPGGPQGLGTGRAQALILGDWSPAEYFIVLTLSSAGTDRRARRTVTVIITGSWT